MTDPQSSNSTKADLRIIQNDIAYIRDDVKEIKLTMANNLVTIDRHETLKNRVSLLERAVYGFITLAVVALLTAVFSGALR